VTPGASTPQTPVATADAPAAVPQRPSGTIRRALSLSLLNTVVARAGTFLAGIVLARLLAPADFGVYAVALVALTALLSLNELGVSVALVRWRGDPRVIAPTVMTISILSSCLLYVGCWFAAPAFAGVMGAPSATGVVRLLCVAVIVDGITAPPAQLLNREFRQGARLVVDLLNLVLATGVTIALAATGHGAWSLAWGQLAGNAISALLLFRLVGSWPRPGFDRSQVRELLAFGAPLAAASALVFAMLNLGYIVVGSALGVVQLGFYLMAFNLASWPVNVFSQVVRRVSLAAFARVQDDPVRREEALARLALLLAVPTLPVCLLLGLLALPVVATLYGDRWAVSAGPLQFLAVLAFVRVAGELAYDYLVALGRSRTTLWLQALWLASLLAALPVGAALDGIRGVAFAHGVVALGVMLPAYAIAVARTGVALRGVGRSLARPFAGGTLLVGAVLAVRSAGLGALPALALGGTLGLAVYVPVVWPVRHRLGKLD
jgi:O-antigen/teichoic acid export membrane protein